MKGVFLDAADGMDAVFRSVVQPDDPPVTLNIASRIASEDLPGLTAGYDFLLDDHSALPTAAMRQCTSLKHIMFLGTGAHSYMDAEELAALGITVHTIKGYGDTAVAEHTIALMWAAARGIARMDRDMRAGHWTRIEGRQMTGKTLGLIGFGGIAAEVARIARGGGMRVLAWNRTPRTSPDAKFVPLDQLLAESDVVSLHLLLTPETRGFLNADRLRRMRPGAVLLNTARAALVDSETMVELLQTNHLAHAALDVFDQEPLPPDHRLTQMQNVTLTAHSGFATPEARQTLVRRALDIAKHLAQN